MKNSFRMKVIKKKWKKEDGRAKCGETEDGKRLMEKIDRGRRNVKG